MKTTVTVCSECLTASCWHGVFMCDNAQSAGTVEVTREQLKQWGYEHEDYWHPDYPNCKAPLTKLRDQIERK